MQARLGRGPIRDGWIRTSPPPRSSACVAPTGVIERGGCVSWRLRAACLVAWVAGGVGLIDFAALGAEAEADDPDRTTISCASGDWSHVRPFEQPGRCRMFVRNIPAHVGEFDLRHIRWRGWGIPPRPWPRRVRLLLHGRYRAAQSPDNGDAPLPGSVWPLRLRPGAGPLPRRRGAGRDPQATSVRPRPQYLTPRSLPVGPVGIARASTIDDYFRNLLASVTARRSGRSERRRER